MKLDRTSEKLGVALAAASLILLLAGCGEQADQAELDLLINEDPVFHELVRTKTNLAAQIAGIQKGLADRKRDMDQQILTLRQTYEADRRAKEQTVNEYESLIKTQKNDFLAGYEKTKAQLDARKRMRSDIERAIQEARGVVAKKDKLAITGKEIGEWEARIANLEARLGPLDAEISTLESLTALKRKKLKYL